MLYTLPILKPLFMAVARLPLVGPHGEREAELLRSGSKPVGMFGSFAPEIADLQKDVDEGRLIRCNVKRTLPHSSTLYGWPGTDMDGIGETYKTLISSTDRDSKNFNDTLAHWHNYKNDLKLTAYNEGATPTSGLKKIFFQAASTLVNLLPQPIESLLGIKHSLNVRLEQSNTEEFLDGTRRAFMARSFNDNLFMPRDLAERLNEKVESGLIQCQKIDCTTDSEMVIFGQPGQEKNVQDLAFVLHNYFNQDALENNTRGITPQSEGQILGYSDRDIEYFQNRASFSRLGQFVLDHTHEIRREIRTGLMKEIGSAWSRNP